MTAVCVCDHMGQHECPVSNTSSLQPVGASADCRAQIAERIASMARERQLEIELELVCIDRDDVVMQLGAAMAREARLVKTAAALLHAIDHEPIRKAALECGQPLYERAADLKDAISACQLPELIHADRDCSALVHERLPNGELAWLKP